MDIFYIIAGLVLVLLGAHLLTEGAAATAEKFGVSQFIIGLTIVSIGTSAPEFVVSLSAAIKGNADMAVGNVVGSNIFNVFVILGICTAISPLALTKHNVKADIPFALAASLLLFVFASDRLLHFGAVDRINRVEGAIMFLLYITLMIYTIRTSKEDRQQTEQPRMGMKKAVIFIAAGLAALIGGSEMFVDGAQELAKRMHISESLIAITLVSVGTSLPELATSLAAVIKRQKGMALGNVLGSNIFNILFILGGCAIITPLSPAGITTLDLGMVVMSALLPLIFAVTFNGRKINRIEGIILLLLYALYMRNLLLNQA